MLDYSCSKKLLDAFGRKIKGSSKTPCLCIGLTAVFLFIFVFLGSSFIVQSLANKGNFCFVNFSKAMGFGQPEKDDLFVNLAKNFSPQSPQFILIENSSLKASSPPTTFSSQVLGTMVAGYGPEEIKNEIIEHVVEQGETLSSLASRFDISLNTILWANGLTEKSIIRPDDKLIILPVSGTFHHVKSGDTVSEVAQSHKGKKDEIVAFNRLTNENDIFIGDIIIVPGGTMPAPVAQQQSYASAPLSSSHSLFIPPVSSPYIITQGLHWYNAIDFSYEGYACGRPIFAVAGGTVQKTGFHRTAGNYVRILHPNGVVTFYGHLSSGGILVTPGQSVSQGTRIGLMGNTGYTIGRTGCHLHFEVRGAANPFTK